jgi:hypothetical protein
LNSAVVLPVFAVAVASLSAYFLPIRGNVQPATVAVPAQRPAEPQPADNARVAAESASAEVAAQLQEYADRPLSVTVLGLPANRAHDSRWQKHTRTKYATRRPGSHRASADRPAGIPAGPLVPSQR